MRLHRFYVGSLHNKRGKLELSQKVWVNDPALINQWKNVLRFKEGNEIILFDDERTERLYRIFKAEADAYGLELVTELEAKIPTRHIYLFWSLLKKDNNDLVLQKCTELGVADFVPLLTEHTEKTGFDVDRAQRIVIEAAEQCGRSDIPRIREPISLNEALDEYKSKVKLYFADISGQDDAANNGDPTGVIIGPEGGWSEQEIQRFNSAGLKSINLHELTLRAETAAIAAASKLLQ